MSEEWVLVRHARTGNGALLPIRRWKQYERMRKKFGGSGWRKICEGPHDELLALRMLMSPEPRESELDGGLV